MLGQIITPFHPEGAHGGEPVEADPSAGAQKRPDIVGAVDVTGIEKDGPGEAQFLIEREPYFLVKLQESGSTDAVIGDPVRGLISAYLNPRMVSIPPR